MKNEIVIPDFVFDHTVMILDIGPDLKAPTKLKLRIPLHEGGTLTMELRVTKDVETKGKFNIFFARPKQNGELI